MSHAPYWLQLVLQRIMRNVQHRRCGQALRTAIAMCAILSVTLSCTETTTEPLRVATVELTPATATVQVGRTVALAATPKDAGGNTVSGADVVWSSSNTQVATVTTGGVVTARAAGQVQIAASAEGKSATAQITIAARDVASVVVTPATVSMRIGVSTPLQVQTLDADGGVLTGRLVTWQSSSPAVAAVSSDGTVTGLSAGAATITATSEGRTGQVAVSVTLPPVQTITVAPAQDTVGVGTERALTATLRDANGNVLSDRTLVWSSNNLSIATVSSAGIVTGVAPGTVTVSATSEGRVGSANIVVLARLAGAVTLTPASATLIAGSNLQLVAQVTDSLGNLLTNRPITFVSDATAVATVSGTGLITAVAPGTARITAQSEGKSGVTTIQVIAVPVASVRITPSALTIGPGTQRQLTAAALSANGTVLTGRTVTWISGSNGIVTVSNTGLVTAVAPGVAVVVALVEGAIAYATVTVAEPAVATMLLAPLEPAIDVGSTVQLQATLRDGDGNTITGRTVTWTSADESVAFVSSSGLVLGLKTGATEITATSGGVSVSTRVTVR